MGSRGTVLMSAYHEHIQRIVRHMIESGLNRDQRLTILTAYTGRTITTTYDLNRNEAKELAVRISRLDGASR